MSWYLTEEDQRNNKLKYRRSAFCDVEYDAQVDSRVRRCRLYCSVTIIIVGSK